MSDISHSILDPPASADSFATDVPGAICTLRILAKFLGFIESFPFSCQSDALPNTILDSQVKLREQASPRMVFNLECTSYFIFRCTFLDSASPGFYVLSRGKPSLQATRAHPSLGGRVLFHAG